MTMSNPSGATLNILVTGGSGFLGQAIVAEFLKDDAPVKPATLRILDIREYKGVRDPRIEFVQGDILNHDLLGQVCAGMDIVIHAAAIVDWGTRLPREVYETNAEGTRHVVNACLEHKVPMMIYCSSLDTVITGHPLRDIDEDQPYPARHLNMYCESKCIGERIVMAAQSPELRTLVLRPSDIYGEGDPFHIPPLIQMARSGFYVRIGNGRSRCQHVYVRNMAWAVVLGAKALCDRNTRVYGRPYFITDGPGTNFFSFFDAIVQQSGHKIWPRNFWLPSWFAYGLGAISEGIARMMRPIHYYHPKLSRFAVMYTSTDFTFNAERARSDFGYQPKYSHEEAIRNTVDYFSKTAAG
jgi:nucleoside-diphosphate-sugar epimerase